MCGHERKDRILSFTTAKFLTPIHISKSSVWYESILFARSPASEHVNRHDSVLPPPPIITATYWPVICLMGCKGKVSVSIIHSRTINHIIWSPLHRELPCAVHSECRKRPIHFCIIWHLRAQVEVLKILFSSFCRLLSTCAFRLIVKNLTGHKMQSPFSAR